MNVEVLLSTLFGLLAVVCLIVAIILGCLRAGEGYTPRERRRARALLAASISLLVLAAPLIALAAGISA